MKKELRRIKYFMYMLALMVGLQAAPSWNVQAQEVLLAEEAPLNDTVGSALPHAESYRTYSLRSTGNGGYYGAQLSGANEQAMYNALAGAEAIRSYNAENGIKVTLPEPYLVEDENNRAADPAYIRFLKEYAKATHAYVRDFGGSYWITSFRAGFVREAYGEKGIKITTVSLYPKDYYDGIRDELGLTDEALEAALQSTDGAEDRYEKVKAAHDYVLELVDYNSADISAPYGHTITGGLLEKYNHLGVCECYAKLFRLICLEADIPCILVTGGSSRNTDGSVNADHMWNYVQMEDGQWYLVDATWDDTGNDPEKYLLAGEEAAGSRHLPVGVFGTVSTAQGEVVYDAFAVPVLAEENYVENVPLQGIVLEEEKLTLEAESEGKVAVSEYFPAYARFDGTYVYRSSAPEVAAVDADGVITAKKAGTAVVTVTADGYPDVTAACTVTVRDHVFTRLMSEEKASCTKAGKQVYRCENCDKTQGKAVPASGHTPGVWKTVRAATVLSEGVQEKRCTVCNALLESKKTAKTAAKVTLNASSLPLQRKKSSAALAVASFTPGDAVASWSSSNPKIVSVNKKTGKITGKKAGTAYVTVTMQSGASARCKVKVQNSAVKTKKLTVSKKAVKLKKGASYKIGVVRSPITASDKVSFTSSNKKVASVNAKGEITAKKKGTAKITVKAGSRRAVIKVTVK